MKIAYSQTHHPKASGLTFRNPRFFAGCEDASEVHAPRRRRGRRA